MSYLSLPAGAVARPLISGVATAAGLRAVAPSAMFGQGITATVTGLGTFAFDTASLAVDNGTTVIKPNDILVGNPGRWLAAGGGGGIGGGGTTDVIPMWSSPTALTDSPISRIGGAIDAGSLTNSGVGYTNGNYINVPLTGGSGTGATADIVVFGTSVITVFLRKRGINYVAGEVLSAATIGPGANFQYTIIKIADTVGTSAEFTSALSVGAGTSSPRGSFDTAGCAFIGVPSGTVVEYANALRARITTGLSIGALTSYSIATPLELTVGMSLNQAFDGSAIAGSWSTIGMYSVPRATASQAGSNYTVYGMYSVAARSYAADLSTTSTYVGILTAAQITGSAIVSASTGTLIGIDASVANPRTGHNVGSMYGGLFRTSVSNGTAGTVVGVRVVSAGSGTITDYFGLRIEQNGALITSNARIGVAQEDPTCANYYQGTSAFGMYEPNPRANVHVGPSTATHGSMFFETGVAPAVPVTGHVWRDGSELYVEALNITPLTANFKVGTAGYGVDFSVTPNLGTSELFDDYEEGTWTPGFTVTGAGASIAIVNADTEAVYTKKGREVTVCFSIAVGAIVNTPQGVDITGLPYPVDSGCGTSGLTVPIDIYLGTGFGNKLAGFAGTLYNGGSSIQLVWYDHGGAVDVTPGPNIQANNSVISASITYFAAT
jgi:hypothetical protein